MKIKFKIGTTMLHGIPPKLNELNPAGLATTYYGGFTVTPHLNGVVFKMSEKDRLDFVRLVYNALEKEMVVENTDSYGNYICSEKTIRTMSSCADARRQLKDFLLTFRLANAETALMTVSSEQEKIEAIKVKKEAEEKLKSDEIIKAEIKIIIENKILTKAKNKGFKNSQLLFIKGLINDDFSEKFLEFSICSDGDLRIEYMGSRYYFPTHFNYVKSITDLKKAIDWADLTGVIEEAPTIIEPEQPLLTIKPKTKEWFATKNNLEKAIKVAKKKGRPFEVLQNELNSHINKI